jgi:hypothetical protein
LNITLTLTQFHGSRARRALGARAYRASGVTAQAPFIGDWRPLQEGDLVLLGSDGVFESMDATLVRVTNEAVTSDSSSPVQVPLSDFGWRMEGLGGTRIWIRLHCVLRWGRMRLQTYTTALYVRLAADGVEGFQACDIATAFTHGLPPPQLPTLSPVIALPEQTSAPPPPPSHDSVPADYLPNLNELIPQHVPEGARVGVG